MSEGNVARSPILRMHSKHEDFIELCTNPGISQLDGELQGSPVFPALRMNLPDAICVEKDMVSRKVPFPYLNPVP